MKKSAKYVVLGAVLVIAFFGIVSNSYAAKPSDYGLQEGDLISAIFSDDPDVYIVNNDGYKRLFLNPEIFNMYGHLGGFFNVKLVPVEVRDAFATSGLFRNCEANDPMVYGVDVEGEDTGNLHWVDVAAQSAISEDPNFFKKVFCINNAEFNWYPKGNAYKKVGDVPNYERLREKAKITTQAKIQQKTGFKNIGKTVICHYPAGNSSAHHTITIATAALEAHLAHGDAIGACEDDSGDVDESDKTAPVITGVTATNITYNSAIITWNTEELSDSLVRYGLTTSYTTYTSLNPSLVASHSVTLSGLSPNTTYHYQAKSRDAAGNLAISADYTFTTLEGSVADTVVPTVPTNLAAIVASSSQINLTWTASTDNVGVVGYKIYRNDVLVANTSGTSYNDIGLTASTAYSYKLAAYDAAGNVSAQTDAVSATTPEAPDTTAPTVPAGLVATAISASQIDLTWTASTDNVAVVGYKIYRDGSLIATPATNSYSDTGLTASTVYTYTVAAYDAASNISAQSASATTTTLAP